MRIEPVRPPVRNLADGIAKAKCLFAIGAFILPMSDPVALVNGTRQRTMEAFVFSLYQTLKLCAPSSVKPP